MAMELRLLTFYPDRMNIYADRGNILFLQKRCEWRGITFSHRGAFAGEGLEAAAHDLFYMGGGQDRDQQAVAADLLASKRDELARAVADGAPMLAVCGGYQLLGHSYQLADQSLPGLGLVDLETVREPGPRLVGNVSIETGMTPHQAIPAADTIPRGERGGPRLVGFENHGGRTTLGEGCAPLGRVEYGHGNNGRDRHEGVRHRNLIGTYLHGPLLPKNWWLADHLIATALERRYGRSPELARLDDEAERVAAARAASVV